MKYLKGKLYKNEIGRWEMNNYEFSSGSILEIKLGGHWIKGVMEHSRDDYYFFTNEEGIPIKLYVNMNVRIANEY